MNGDAVLPLRRVRGRNWSLAAAWILLFLDAPVDVGTAAHAPACAAEPNAPAAPADPKFTLESLRGRVVWSAEAMARLHGAQSADDALQRTLALETSDGRLHPLLEDVRGRAFRADARLRRMEVELLVRRYPHAPIVQVVNVYELSAEGKFEIDYWCEVCAIAMFELKACECCQGEIELRRRRVVEMPADDGR